MKEHYEINTLKDLFKVKYLNSNSKGLDKVSGIAFNGKLDDEIELINKRISKNNYVFSLYLEKLVIKNRFKKPRILSVPTIRDRITLNQLKNYLQTKIPQAVFRKQAQECVREIKNEIVKDDYNYFIRTDLTNFFDRIERELLKKKLEKLSISDYPLQLVMESIENPTVPKNYNKSELNKFKREKGVPQGLSISSFLAQVYLLEFDKEIGLLDCFMVRYIDDILILCKSPDAKYIMTQIQTKLSDLNLELNDDKTYEGLLTYSFEFLGYQFKDRKLSIAEKNIQKRINAIAGRFTLFSKGWTDKNKRVPYLKNDDDRFKLRFIDQLNNLISGVVVEGKKRSFVDYYREIDEISILFRLDKIVRRLLTKHSAFPLVPHELKSFVKSYYELKYNKESKYLTDLDLIYDIKDKRKFLVEFGYLYKYKKYTDSEILNTFNRYKNKQIRANKKLSYSSS